MSNYYSSLLGINHKGQYTPGIFAGEGHGSSQMTYTLGQMINTAIAERIYTVNQTINATIEAQMQALIIQLISQLLQGVTQHPQDSDDGNDGNDGDAEPEHTADITQDMPAVDEHSHVH